MLILAFLELGMGRVFEERQRAQQHLAPFPLHQSSFTEITRDSGHTKLGPQDHSYGNRPRRIVAPHHRIRLNGARKIALELKNEVDRPWQRALGRRPP